MYLCVLNLFFTVPRFIVGFLKYPKIDDQVLLKTKGLYTDLPKVLTLLNLAKGLERYKRTLVYLVEKPYTTPRKDKNTKRYISSRDM